MAKKPYNPFTEHLKLSRNQMKKLKRMADKLSEMSCEWDGLDGGNESSLNQLSDLIQQFCSELEELREDWYDYNEPE